MSGDDRSERFTEESSGYGTLSSPAPSEAPSEQSYQDSINTGSSGIGSMSSGALRSPIKPEGSKLRKRLAKNLTLQNTTKQASNHPKLS